MGEIVDGAPYDAAIQGDQGSNSEIAAQELLNNPRPKLHYCTWHEEMFEAVSNGTAEYAVVAVENALAGPVTLNLDLLYQHRLYINAETALRIEFALVAAPGVALEVVRYAYSHPVALDQCRNFFRSHPNIERVPADDTAGSVKKVVSEGRLDAAGIAGSWTAELFGGNVLIDHIEDQRENYTRFFLVSREPRFPVNIDEYKVSMVFLLLDQPGALYYALRPFAEREINLSNIEKRPIPGDPFKYRFYLDLERKAGQGPAMDEALAELERLSTSMRILGKFPVRTMSG